MTVIRGSCRKSGGFMLVNDGKAQFCHIISADYDIYEFSVNGGKAQKMARDFSVEIDSGKLVSEVA